MNAIKTILTCGLLFTAGCIDPSESLGGGDTDGKADGQSFNPYAATRGECSELGDRDCLRRLSPLAPNNVTIGNGVVRDQGKLASCASHGFIGMLENQLWLQRGIEVDLAERYQLYSNFMSSGNIGNDTNVIKRFPQIAAQYGIMPEALYPYGLLNANAAAFDQDLAQGLGASDAPSLADAIQDTDPDTRKRSDVLTEPQFLAALPAPGGRPVAIPIAATLAADADVPEVEYVDADGNASLASCFATTAGNKLTLTPREFTQMCLDLQPSQYFACGGYEADTSQHAGESDCDYFKRISTAWADGMVSQNLRLLANVLDLLDVGQSSVIGVNAPQSNQVASVWAAKGNLFGAGHAVVAVGYVTADELADPTEQARGLLASEFDKLAAAIEPEYAGRITTNMTSTQLRDIRVASALGQIATSEGGLLLFRNSWGANVQGTEIGVDGYQTMTFSYFLRSATLFSESRTVGIVDAQSCAPVAGMRTDAFFSTFSTRAAALGKNAAMTSIVGQLVASGATNDQVNVAIQTLQSCQ